MQFIVCYVYASRTLASNCVTLFPGRSYMKSAHARFTQPGPERQGTFKLPEIFKLALLRLCDCLSERTIQKRLEREISSWSFVCLPSSSSVGFSTFLGAEKDLRTNGLASEFPSPSLSYLPSFNRRGSLNRPPPPESVIVRTRVQFHPICRYDTAKIHSREGKKEGRSCPFGRPWSVLRRTACSSCLMIWHCKRRCVNHYGNQINMANCKSCSRLLGYRAFDWLSGCNIRKTCFCNLWKNLFVARRKASLHATGIHCASDSKVSPLAALLGLRRNWIRVCFSESSLPADFDFGKKSSKTRRKLSLLSSLISSLSAHYFGGPHSPTLGQGWSIRESRLTPKGIN